MSMFSNLKGVVIGQAMKLATNPSIMKVATDPRVMNAAMKAMSMSGQVKANVDKCGRVAAGVFGFATAEDVANLRSTIQTLEDQLAAVQGKQNG